MKTGLVLEGGGLRCLFTAGVLDVLQENDIKVDSVIGVSAGAVFGCNYKSGQKGRTLRYNLNYADDPRYFSLQSLLSTGNLFNEEFCYDTIPNHLDPFDYETFRSNDVDFYAVSTNLETGVADYHLCSEGDERDLKYMQASASMPFVSKPVEIDDRKFLDGGIADPIPIRFAEKIGMDKLIVIRPHPDEYKKSSIPGASLSGLFYKDYPGFIDTLKNHQKIYNEEVEYLNSLRDKNKAMVISPNTKVEAGVVERDQKKLLDAYTRGRQAAEDRLEELRQFIDA